jgi:hypothetical protein
LIDAPEDAFVNVYDKESNFYASISEEGTIIDCLGNVMGFINVENKCVASKDEEFLGSFLGDTVVGPNDEHFGEIDRGRGLIIAANGSSVLELEGTGHCKGATSCYLGEFRGFGYGELEIVALFVLLIDRKFLEEE